MMFSGVAMSLRKTADRNRAIFAAFEAGRSAESLGEQYGVTVERVRVILTDERNRRDLSPESFYRILREA